MNKVILMGRLTKDPDYRTAGQTTVARYTLAVNRIKKDDPADFINCVAWNKTAEFVSNYFSKGKMIIVIGRISTRTWEGQDGKKNYSTEVVASEVSFGESKRSQEGGDNYSAPAQSAPRAAAPAAPSFPDNASDDAFTPLLDTDDDLPF